MERVDGDLTAVAGGEEDAVAATAVDGLHPGENAPAGAGVRVDGDDVSHLESELRLDQVVQIGDGSRAPGRPGGTGCPSASTFSTSVVSSNRWMPWWCSHSDPNSPSGAVQVEGAARRTRPAAAGSPGACATPQQ